MPFTDPMADGPAIQAAGLRALKAGMTLRKTLGMVRDFRERDDDTPIVLMGYYNPIYVYGVERFLADAQAAGVDGLIVVDLPPEEDDELCMPALDAGPATSSASRRRPPTTSACRRCSRNTSGFVYYVSITGITGAAIADYSTGRERRGAHQAPHAPAGRGRLRHEERRRRPPPSRARRRRRGRLGARRRHDAVARRRQQGDDGHRDRGHIARRRARGRRECARRAA